MKYIAKLNGKQYEVEVEKVKNNYTPISRNSGTAPQSLLVADVPVPPILANVADAGETAVTSPLPGSVLAVKVSVGQTVKAGQVLILLEAMKMENEIVAPVNATVKKIIVIKGASVNTDDVLVVLG